MHISAASAIRCHGTPSGGILYVDPTQPDKGLAFKKAHSLACDGYVYELLKTMSTHTDFETIRSRFVAKHGRFVGRALFEHGIRILSEQNLLVVSDEEPNDKHSIKLTGSRDAFYPMHVTFEIIETCNFACEHCYYSSSPEKTGAISRDDAFAIIDKAVSLGVNIIELTGGECTIHRDFLEILDYAAQKFKVVAVVTNGYRLGSNPAFLDKVASYDNVIVQISIDGTEHYHNLWRRHKGSFKTAVTALKSLSARGVITRMACSLSDASVDQVDDLIDIATDCAVNEVSFAPVAAIGRGCNVTDPGAGAKHLLTQLNERLRKHADHPAVNAHAKVPVGAQLIAQRNCGAGSRSYTVDYNGDVRACNYSRQSKRFGNLLTQDADTVFGQEANYKFFAAPRPGGAECEGCAYTAYCTGCFVKAFTLSEKDYPDCPWRKKWFGDMPLEMEANPRCSGFDKAAYLTRETV